MTVKTSRTVKISRRRAITVLAAAAGLPLVLKATAAQARMVRWEGTTLGAPSTIQLFHQDESQARAAIDAGLAELARLEQVFSIYRADSVLSRLNREGSVDDAPAEFTELLRRALTVAELSGGAYDPTVQPVWSLYFRHFTAATVDPAGPSRQDLDAALKLVGWRDIDIDGRRVSFRRPGMALTLNSGAQGYITDRVADVLRAHGFASMLVDMGEPRALSAKPDGSAWRIGIANPADQSKAVTELDVVDKCVATSGGYGTIFDDAGQFTHIIDPRSGRTVPARFGVSVVAPTATQADGLSTAMLLVEPEKRQSLLRAAGGEMALFVTPDGVLSTVQA
jgi:thiamine biosynthesis lipoprotein